MHLSSIYYLFIIYIYSIQTTCGVVYKEYDIIKYSSLELPCSFSDITDENTIVWKRGNDTLFIDEDQLSYDERYSVMRSSTTSILIIKSVEPIDNTVFKCELTESNQQLVFRLSVNNPPKVHLIPNQKEFYAQQGDRNLVIRCIAHGNPKPLIKWLNSHSRMANDSNMKDYQLIFPIVYRDHSGKYCCNATNTVGSSQECIDIKVYVRPDIKAEETFLSVVDGSEQTISCVFGGFPIPSTDWQFNGQKINFASDLFQSVIRHVRRSNGSHVTSLYFPNMTVDHFGDYICRVSNTIGSDKAVIHASARPGPPTIIFQDKTLFWTLQSKIPMIEYKLYSRYQNDEEWINFENILVKQTDNVQSDRWEREIQLEDYFEPEINYEIQVQGRNSFGWGSLAKNYIAISYSSSKKKLMSLSPASFNVTIMLCLLVFNSL
ncbi:unnamed protein product [Auanema sp. JU1783]|nr:unnamed protein product [Auanema sp. JU1783]